MSKNEKALVALVIGLVVGAAAQQVVSAEAAALGLSALEIALLGLIAGGVVRRAI